jgi:hypothetical protein
MQEDENNIKNVVAQDYDVEMLQQRIRGEVLVTHMNDEECDVHSNDTSGRQQSLMIIPRPGSIKIKISCIHLSQVQVQVLERHWHWNVHQEE